MKVLSSNNIIFKLDKKNKEAIIVEPSESIIVETLDARCGKLRKEEDVFWTTPDFSSPLPKVDPVTGPIKVKGAQPGDSVMIKIEDIILDNQGFVLIKPKFGIIDNMVRKPIAKIIKIEKNFLYFSDNIILKIEPMVGVVATTPSNKAPFTWMLGNWGGNIDNKRICKGSKVFLPVFIEGAMICIGDVHARMGDGEATGTGVEINAKVKIKIELLKNYETNFPYIETDDLMITTGVNSDYFKASRIAVEEMIKKLVELLGITKENAYMLISIAGDIKLSQACSPLTDMSVRVEFPKKEVLQLLKNI